MRQLILWVDDDEIYKASYSDWWETITVRKNDTNELIYRKYHVSKFEWTVFKLKVFRWKRPVQDVEKNFQ